MEKACALHLKELERTCNQRVDEGWTSNSCWDLGGQLEEVGVALERALLEAKISKAQWEDSQARIKSLEAQVHEAENRVQEVESVGTILRKNGRLPSSKPRSLHRL